MNNRDQNSGLSFEERVSKKLADRGFIDFCKRERNREDFDIYFSLVEKLAKVDISIVNFDKDVKKHSWTKTEAEKDLINFYAMIDNLSPSGTILLDRVEQNLKYLKYGDEKGGRSHCLLHVDKDGKVTREIYIKLDHEINDTIMLAHEFCHSLCECFINLAKEKDSRVDEIPSVIVDNLMSSYLESKYPEIKEEMKELDKKRQFVQIKKARECLLDGVIVKVVCGEISIDEAKQKYGYLFKPFKELLGQKLEQIENFKFFPMFEKKYLVPQAISLQMRDRFKKNPENVATQLKYLIENVHVLTEEQALDYLQLPSKEKLIDNYIKDFPKRIKTLDDEKVKSR